MFGLGNQIGRHDGGLGRFITNDQHFRRSSQHVNTAMTIHNGFCCRHPLVARATNNVATGHVVLSFDTVSHGGNGLSTTDAQEIVGAGNVPRRQGDECRFGTRQYDRFTTSGASRHGRHDHRGRKGVPPPRCITAGRLARTHRVSGFATGNVHFHVVDTFPLHFGKCLDATMNVHQGRAVLVRQLFKGGLALFFGNGKACCVARHITKTFGNLQ
mmetsp:Transcript_15686/g.34307  ORF Transcript_15686/g.34307 Transcript_15686/m.34307 type:complete len:214 (-) Transcript_15686:286-927(-)